MSVVARRYARAAVDAARAAGDAAEVEALAEGLRTFATLYKESSELHQLITNPALKVQRAEILAKVSGEMSLSETASSLVSLLAENDRIGELTEVVRHVVELADEQTGRQRAQVTSAIELDDVQKARIAVALEKRLQVPVVLDVEIDPSILGGLVCVVGDTTIDSSLRYQLERVSERLYALYD